MSRYDAFVRPALATAMARADVGEVVVEKDQPGHPHKGKVFAAVHAHLDDIPYYAAGLCAKLIARRLHRLSHPHEQRRETWRRQRRRRTSSAMSRNISRWRRSWASKMSSISTIRTTKWTPSRRSTFAAG